MDRKGTLGLEPEEIAELHSQHREGRARQNELQDELDYERDVLAGENLPPADEEESGCGVTADRVFPPKVSDDDTNLPVLDESPSSSGRAASPFKDLIFKPSYNSLDAPLCAQGGRGTQDSPPDAFTTEQKETIGEDHGLGDPARRRGYLGSGSTHREGDHFRLNACRAAYPWLVSPRTGH